MSTIVAPYLCDAWLVEERCIADDDDHDFFLPKETMFLIDIYGHIGPYNSGDGPNNRYEEVAEVVPVIMKRFALTKNQLVRDHGSWSVVVGMLSEMDIPGNAHPMVIQKIHECARGCVSIGSEAVPMVVQVRSAIPSTVFRPGSGNEACCNGFVPEMVRVEGCPRQCVICLEDLFVGMQAARMPCLHVYHERCIKNWLEKSNACPLCRFRMPATC